MESNSDDENVCSTVEEENDENIRMAYKFFFSYEADFVLIKKKLGKRKEAFTNQ